MFRKAVFWIHLACGVTAGLVILVMSTTGVLLTYERQILAWLDGAQYADPAPGAVRAPLADLLDAARRYDADFVPTALTLRNDPRAPVTVSAGRTGTLFLNPYTAEVAPQGGATARAFFNAVEGWHRWFNLSGDARRIARTVTAACNLAFLFLVLSGLYLWLPRVFMWAAFKARLAFNPKATTAKARDFNWHHVFGIWSAIPLAVIVACSVVFSYSWANDLVYRSVGDRAPVRGANRGPSGADSSGLGAAGAGSAGSGAQALSYDELFAKAAAAAPGWRALTLNVGGGGLARFSVDQGNGGQPQRRHTLTLDAISGEVEQWTPFSSLPAGQRVRAWIRFLHTGEALGIVGQTVAGAVSVTSLVMVWTGLALAYRRLISPLLARRATTPSASTA